MQAEQAADVADGTGAPAPAIHDADQPYNAVASSSARAGRNASAAEPEAPAANDEEETRQVEENLRRMLRQEHETRRQRYGQITPGQSSGGLVRRLSVGLSKMPTWRARRPAPPPAATAGDESFEMAQSHYERDDHAAGHYGPVGDSTEDAPYAHDAPPVHTSSRWSSHGPYQAANDLTLASVESISTPLSLNTLAKPYDDGSALVPSPIEPGSPLEAPVTYRDTAPMSTALARIRSRNFPTVTVGRASTRQQWRRSGLHEQGSSSAYTPAPGRSTIIAPGTTALVEGEEPSTNGDVTDVSLEKDDAMTPVSLASSRFPDDGLPRPAHTYDHTGAQRHDTSPDPDETGRWYWSDLLLGCGFCLSHNDDEEQAARTNPME